MPDAAEWAGPHRGRGHRLQRDRHALSPRFGPWTRPLPGTLTGDVVGRIARLGEGVEGVAVGERVAALSEDAFADYVTADARWLAPAPEGVDGARRPGCQ